jgi:hypothetical protein
MTELPESSCLMNSKIMRNILIYNIICTETERWSNAFLGKNLVDAERYVITRFLENGMFLRSKRSLIPSEMDPACHRMGATARWRSSPVSELLISCFGTADVRNFDEPKSRVIPRLRDGLQESQHFVGPVPSPGGSPIFHGIRSSESASRYPLRSRRKG